MPIVSLSEEAKRQLFALQQNRGQQKRFKAVCSALKKMRDNLRHPGLNTHPLKGMLCPHKKTLFEAYAENNTPAAYRILWCYDPSNTDTVIVTQIIPHL